MGISPAIGQTAGRGVRDVTVKSMCSRSLTVRSVLMGLLLVMAPPMAQCSVELLPDDQLGHITGAAVICGDVAETCVGTYACHQPNPQVNYWVECVPQEHGGASWEHGDGTGAYIKSTDLYCGNENEGRNGVCGEPTQNSCGTHRPVRKIDDCPPNE